MSVTAHVDLLPMYMPEPLTSNASNARAIIANEYAPRKWLMENEHSTVKESGDAAEVLRTYLATKDACLDLYGAELRRDHAENDLAMAVKAVYDRDPLPEYTGTTLGTATLLGSAEGGTAEWHALRQFGIGGSQVLEAAGWEDKGEHLRQKSDLYRNYALRDLIEEKTADPNTLTEEPKQDAAWRGHMWEPILLDVHRRLSGMNVVISKQTWRGRYPWQIINVDGIILNSDGTPRALIECKNSNAPYRWINGVPLSYRAQVLYYLDATGLEFCDVIYRVDGDVHITRIVRGETVDGSAHIESFYPALDAAWRAVLDVRADANRVNNYLMPFRQPIANYGSSWAAAYDNVWALLHATLSRDEVVTELRRRKNAYGSLDMAVKSLLREAFDPGKLGRMVGVDGETAAITSVGRDRPFSPMFSDWIETGVAKLLPEGIEVHVRRHGIDPRILSINGTGAQHIHEISPEDIQGLPQFTSDSAWLREHLSAADIIVAHNARFEKKFLEPVLYDITTTRPWLDTLWLTKHFMPDRTGRDRNKLEDFVTGNGIPYTNGHHADHDARMMMEALRVFLQHWRP